MMAYCHNYEMEIIITKKKNCESPLWESLWQKDKIMSHYEMISHDKKLWL